MNILRIRVDNEYPIEIISGDNAYCRIRTEEVFIGKPGKPIVEDTTLGWVIHGGELSGNSCMHTKVVSDYDSQLTDGIIEKVPDELTGKRVFYFLPHKPVVRQYAMTTKTRMVFDASPKPHPLASSCSINECMYTGPALQPLLCDILIRARMSPICYWATSKRHFTNQCEFRVVASGEARGAIAPLPKATNIF